MVEVDKGKQVKITLTHILWPVAGGLLGFMLFFLLLATGGLITPDHIPDKAVDLLGVTVATFVAAWAGGWAAFRAERETQDINRKNSRISAANKAIFKIATAYTVFENLRQHYIDFNAVRNDPDRALKMDSPQPGMLSEIKFNFDELSFFLDQPGNISSDVLMELMMFEWQYQVLFQTIEHRAKASEELHTAMQARPVANLEPDGIKTIYPVPYQKLDATTTQMIESVDAGLINAKEVNRKLQLALQQLFPEQSFLQINFNGNVIPSVHVDDKND